MITVSIIDDFVARVSGPTMRQGTRYAREARVTGFTGTLESVTTVVRGTASDHDVALWSEAAALQHRCDCSSWRVPCRHEVAAALVLRQILASDDAEMAEIKAIESPYVFALTGTPLENRLEEAYAVSQLIDQRLLPPLWQLDRDHSGDQGIDRGAHPAPSRRQAQRARERLDR